MRSHFLADSGVVLQSKSLVVNCFERFRGTGGQPTTNITQPNVLCRRHPTPTPTPASWPSYAQPQTWPHTHNPTLHSGYAYTPSPPAATSMQQQYYKTQTHASTVPLPAPRTKYSKSTTTGHLLVLGTDVIGTHRCILASSAYDFRKQIDTF